MAFAEDVAVEHAALGQALGARRQHVLLADLFDEGVLGEEGEAGEAADHHGADRQHHVPEIVGDLVGELKLAQSSDTRPRSGNHFT
jgi:hypothetical protein